MTPKNGPRDWDRELAEVDRLIEGLQGPGAQPDKRKGPGAAQQLATVRQQETRRETAATWLWFILAAALGSALAWFWPYSRACGLPLYGYLGSIVVFGLASAWSTGWSWRTRSVVVHYLSVGLLFGVAVLGAREVLPRVGYARQSATWSCRAAPAQVAAPPAPAPAPPATAAESVPAQAAPQAVPPPAAPRQRPN